MNPILLHSYSAKSGLLSGKLPLSDFPALARDLGFDGVEWMDRFMPQLCVESWSELARAQERAGLKLAAMSLNLEVTAPPADLALQVDRAKEIISLCPILGVSTIRLGLGGGKMSRLLWRLESLRSANQRRKQLMGGFLQKLYAILINRAANQDRSTHGASRPMEDVLQKCAWVVEPLCRQAADLGMKPCLENHSGITSHPEDLLQIIELCREPVPGVCLDTGNHHPGLDGMEQAAFLAQNVSHIHFKVLGDDFVASEDKLRGMEQLKSLQGYQGSVSVEWIGKGGFEKICREARDHLAAGWA